MASSFYWLGVSFAITSGISNQIGTVFQKKVVNELPEESKFMRSLIKNRLWLFGLLLQYGLGAILYISPNYFFGFKKKDLALTYKLITCHKTQRWLLNWTMLPYRFTSRFAGRKLRGWKYAEPYRRIYFNKRNLKKNKVSCIINIFTHFYSSLPWFKAKYPQDIIDKIRKKRI